MSGLEYLGGNSSIADALAMKVGDVLVAVNGAHAERWSQVPAAIQDKISAHVVQDGVLFFKRGEVGSRWAESEDSWREAGVRVTAVDDPPSGLSALQRAILEQARTNDLIAVARETQTRTIRFWRAAAGSALVVGGVAGALLGRQLTRER